MESSGEIKYLFFIGTGIVLLIAIAFLFMAVYYQRHFAKMKQKEAEMLLKAALASEKQERQRIAKDLHDGVQGDLGAIRNYLTLLTRNVLEPEATDLLNAIQIAVTQTIANARLISYNLMPPLLESAGFSMAIRDYFENLNKSSDATFTIQTDFPTVKIPTIISYELFRIVQEFTSNMLKYGNISECHLIIYETKNILNLELIDDGQPFDFKISYSASKGAGLYNIQSRLTIIEATMVQRTVVKGNHFVIYIPYTP